jgi:phosphomannomutase
MEAGFARMNDLTVLQASQGLCEYVLRHVENAAERGVVIGHDHRHHSESFARLTAAAFLHRGVRVYYYHKLVHTPLVPFGIKHLNAACGVMITASHNPKDDNGYKVYWSNSCQIIPPHDSGIAQSILENLEPWLWDKQLVDSHPLCTDPVEEIEAAYFDELRALAGDLEANAATTIKFAYTAMHGVGEPFARRAFQLFNLPDYALVSAQAQPDPDFPTVKFPNPEEKGALDLARQVAEDMGADIVLANDPDADRFTAIEKQPDGQWRTFSGNELGTLFAYALYHDLLRRGVPKEKIAMTCSAVSSKMLERIAAVEGFHFEERLTGFKWLGNGALEMRAQGYTVPLAYEEAIGYMIGDIVPDKDGISALAYFCQMAVELYAKGTTIGAHLDQLYATYGHFRSNNSYVKCYSADTIRKLFDRIRFGEVPQPSTDSIYAYALAYPKEIGGFAVTYVRDLTIGYDSSQPDGRPTLPTDASAQMVTFRLENGCCITLRTSGTEPKIKWYIEHHGPEPELVEQELAKIVYAAVEDLLEPERNQLIR